MKYTIIEYLPMKDKIKLVEEIIAELTTDEVNGTFINPIKQRAITMIYIVKEYCPQFKEIFDSTENIYELYEKAQEVIKYADDQENDKFLYEREEIYYYIESMVNSINQYQLSLPYFLEKFNKNALETAADFGHAIESLKDPDLKNILSDLKSVQE